MSLPTITVSESGGGVFHEELEWYSGRIGDIEATPDDRGFGPGLKFIIYLDGELADNGEEIETWAFCSQKMSPKSKLYRWSKAILGEGALPAKGEAFDLSTLLGTRVDVMFEHYKKDRDGEMVDAEKVKELRAAKQGGKPTQAAAPAKAAEVSDDLDAPF